MDLSGISLVFRPNISLVIDSCMIVARKLCLGKLQNFNFNTFFRSLLPLYLSKCLGNNSLRLKVALKYSNYSYNFDVEQCSPTFLLGGPSIDNILADPLAVKKI